jgi:acetylornithine/LysW-gamma-L-lysine aminotransferase
MVAVELKIRNGPVLSVLLDNGIAAIPSGSTIIRFLPPLTVTKDDIDHTVQVLGDILNG